ncbi:MAG: hypothetical protein IJ523_07095 [Succinivibrionaceae bacterium]|nr:hypothetical protein [Succinivibrionaceae bacterium]
MIGKDEVAGSNPAISSINPVRNDWFSYVFGHFSAFFRLLPCKEMTSSVFPSEIRQLPSSKTLVPQAFSGFFPSVARQFTLNP